MGNEHVTDKQLKNGVFTAFGVFKEIIKIVIEMIEEPLKTLCFQGFF